jgi:hypothetical protein
MLGDEMGWSCLDALEPWLLILSALNPTTGPWKKKFQGRLPLLSRFGKGSNETRRKSSKRLSTHRAIPPSGRRVNQFFAGACAISRIYEDTHSHLIHIYIKQVAYGKQWESLVSVPASKQPTHLQVSSPYFQNSSMHMAINVVYSLYGSVKDPQIWDRPHAAKTYGNFPFSGV